MASRLWPEVLEDRLALSASAVLASAASHPPLPTGEVAIDGEQWYSLTPAADGTLKIDARMTTLGAKLTVSVYDDQQHLLSTSSATGSAHVSLRRTVEAGETYLVKLAGEDATADVSLSSQPDAWDCLDASRDGVISAIDALQVINELLRCGAPVAAAEAKAGLDCNLDGMVSAIDALMVINHLLASSAPASGGGGGAGGAGSAELAFALAVEAEADEPLVAWHAPDAKN